jgi:hypothetical protein
MSKLSISLFRIDERAKNINNTIKPGYKTLGENKIPFNGDNPLEKLEIILAKIIIINSTIIAPLVPLGKATSARARKDRLV